VSHWRIDARHSNSHTAWCALGCPQDPSASDLHAIEARQRLERYEPDRTDTVRDGGLMVRVVLPLPGVSLVEIRPAS
jgi:xylan 1,4-beta-xylosidase